MFSLIAQVLGQQVEVQAVRDGVGITVHTPSGPVSARSVNDAVRIAHRHLGVVLQRAERPGIPWGLHVSAGEVAAVYGKWPLLPGPVDQRRAPESAVSRIRRRWHDGDGPLAALENALAIVRHYTAHRAAA